MKIMTFNTQHCVNHLEKRVDYDIIAKEILECGADIVGLNEMFSSGGIYPNQTEKLAKLTGIESYFFAEAIKDFSEGPYGNGLLSKYRIVKSDTIKIPDPSPRLYNGYYETRCVLRAELENGYTVLVCHFGLNPDEQENAVKTILDNLTPKKCILMGDFNLTPSSPILDPIKEKMKDASYGFCQDTPTWPSDNPEIKIDYIFVSRDLSVEWARVSEKIASDPRAHVAKIKEQLWN